MKLTPLTAATTTGMRFLGGHLCSLAGLRCRSLPTHFNADVLAACAQGTYRRCLSKTAERVTDLRAARLSLVSRAENWNTFCVSTTPYPATIVPITGEITATLQHHLTRLFPCRSWMQHTMITDLGMLLNLRGTPRDPGLIANTASIVMYSRGGLASPHERPTHVSETIANIQAWALSANTCSPV